MSGFTSEDLKGLVSHKTIIFAGGSIMRGLYKDLVWLLNTNTFIPEKVLGRKGEKKFPDLGKQEISKKVQQTFKNNQDILNSHNYHGVHSHRKYNEERRYYNPECKTTVLFRFVTKCWNEDMKNWLTSSASRSDVIFFNSGLWDVNRWGPAAPGLFQPEVHTLLECISSTTTARGGKFVWVTTPPVSEELLSRAMAMKTDEMVFNHDYLSCYNVIEANHFAAQVVRDKGFAVVDLHAPLLSWVTERNLDGIHWSSKANRIMTNIIINHLAHLLGHPRQEIDKKSFLNSLKMKGETATGLQGDDFISYCKFVKKEKKEQEQKKRQDRKDRLIERSSSFTQLSSSMHGWVDYDNCNLDLDDDHDEQE